MITLCGFPLSNYYNKVKLALLEKGVDFTEERVAIGATDEAVLSCSPLGKIPFLRTAHGALCESQPMLDYIEAVHPAPALLPADAWGRAKQHELITFLDLHLELVARELYPQAFFGGSVSEAIQASVRKRLDKHLAGFRRLASFTPYVAGPDFTMADCAAYVHLPLVGLSTRIIYGEDLVLAHGIDWKAYAKRVSERPSAQRVDADRKGDQAARQAG
ncbi:glutathione S-transferase [Aquincola sp. MAHUQ-54]|uniref:Glutathione S-transferase n=1 Tax=Aquincola agrisoli TaxID=3119538 RepID=A0AAW9QE73_9BURK